MREKEKSLITEQRGTRTLAVSFHRARKSLNLYSLSMFAFRAGVSKIPLKGALCLGQNILPFPLLFKSYVYTGKNRVI